MEVLLLVLDLVFELVNLYFSLKRFLLVACRVRVHEDLARLPITVYLDPINSKFVVFEVDFRYSPLGVRLGQDHYIVAAFRLFSGNVSLWQVLFVVSGS